mgnify:CR=1 FL=1
MDSESYIHKYYANSPELEALLLLHSRQVAEHALRVAESHPECALDTTFLYEAALLHDIGIIQCDAPSIMCHGTHPYILHGYLGGQMLRTEGLPRHARVCERHTGTGLTAEQILQRQLPLPPGNYCPETLEEQVICYADKFYSKSSPQAPKSLDHVLRSLSRFGEEGVRKFLLWHEQFG